MKNKRKQNKKSKIFFITLIIAIVILLAFNIASYARSRYSVLDEKEIYAKIIISDRHGFDVNATALTFGMTIPGGSATVKSIIQNQFDFPVKVQISSRGRISELLLVSDNNFILQANEINNLTFTASASPETPYGFYDGYVDIITRKA